MNLSLQHQADIDAQTRRVVYDHFIRLAACPSKAAVASHLSLSEAEVADSFARLAQAHMLVLQPQSGEVLMANPFSAVPTAFRVATAGQQWWGNCIWDALGIIAMVSVDGTIQTSCPDCGEALKLSVTAGALAGANAVGHFGVPAARWWDNIVFT